MSVKSLEYPRAIGVTKARRSIAVPVPFFLAWKDLWRNRKRYILISLVVALITTLVLFIAGLAEGLGTGNREYIEKLNAQVLLYQKNVDLSIPSSRLGWSKMREVNRVDGVAGAGFIGFSNASLVFDDQKPLKISLLGVQPGKPGEPPAIVGQNLMSNRGKEVIIDQNVASRRNLNVGDTITVKSILGADEEFYGLEVVGISDSRQYSIQPSIFVPYQTWDKIKPRSAEVDDGAERIYNIIAVATADRVEFDTMQTRLEEKVSNVEAVDRVQAYQATPGYSAQQSTLNTQRIFTLIIGILVLGGFFQIQTLQKVAQVGMLKAMGTSSLAIVLTSIIQIVAINIFGVAIGLAGTFALGAALPQAIPLVFEGSAVTSAIFSLLLIGPIGGVVSIITLLRTEPLTALGLAS